MDTDANLKDPLFGVDFTVEELRELIDAHVLDEQLSLSSSAVLSWAIEVLPIVAQTSEDYDDDAALATEEYISGVASIELERLNSIEPSNDDEAERKTQVVKRLRHQTKTPLKDKKHAQDDALKAEEKKAEIARIQTDISKRESAFATSSSKLRELTYKSQDKTRNGVWLRRQITDITDPGSQESLFMNEEAQSLAGLALSDMTHLGITNIQAEIKNLSELYQKVIKLGGSVEPGLFRAIQTLKELHEGGNGQLASNAELAPLKKLASVLFKDSDELLNQFINTLDEGPFSNCEEIPVSPFTAESYEGEDLSIVEIDEDLVSAENIKEDIEIAVSKSEAKGYIVEQARINDFIELRNKLIAAYGASNIRTIRTLSSKWHPLPWYALEVSQSNEDPRVIMESPIWGNASYFINNEDWVGIIKHFNRRDAQKFGAKPRVHKYGSEGKPFGHIDKLYRLVRGS